MHNLWFAVTAREFGDEARRDAVAFIDATDRPEWRWLDERYEEMAGLAEASGASFAILAMPYQQQTAKRASRRVQDHLSALGRQHGWPIIDPLDAFQEAHAAGTRVFMDWWHPTPAGHRLAAKATARALACGGQLGEAARHACARVLQSR